MFKTVGLLIALLAGTPVAAHAATYYVDNSSGSNCANSSTSSGSQSSPWCAVTYALGRIAGGDTLLIKSGTYSGLFTITGTLSGTAASVTTIAAYPGATVTIQGAGVHTGRLRIQNASYITLSGLTITAMNQGIFIEGSSNITLKDSKVHLIGQEAVHIHANSSAILIENNQVYDTGNYNNLNGEGIYIGTGSSGTRDNTHNVVVRGNTIHDTTDEAVEIKPGTHDCVVDGNTIYNSLHRFGASVGSIEVGEHAVGNQFWGSNPNHRISNNRIYASKTAIRLGTGSTVYNNVIYGLVSGQYGIYLNNPAGDSYSRRIYHNTIDMPSSTAVIVSGTVTRDIRNNIGPSLTSNIVSNSAYFVSISARDYHLVDGSAPVDAGVNLSGVVPTDKDGQPRSQGAAPDMGAYESGSTTAPSPPSAPTNLRIITSALD